MTATDSDLARIRARAAKAGVSLCEVPEPGGGAPEYIVSRWGMSRVLPDLAAVALFLRKVGAPE